MNRRVWMIVCEVIASKAKNSAGLSVQSTALVQCFVPTLDLNTAQRHCTSLLENEGFLLRRIETTVEFNEDESYPNAPEFVIEDVARAREEGIAFTGTFFVSKDSASFHNWQQ